MDTKTVPVNLKERLSPPELHALKTWLKEKLYTYTKDMMYAISTEDMLRSQGACVSTDRMITEIESMLD